MLRSFANFLSYLCHPLLMPFYAILLIFNLNTYLSYSITPPLQKIIYIVIFITTFVMPVLFAMFLVQKGMIKSLEMERKEERRIPFITTIFFYLICYLLLKQLSDRIPGFIPLIILGGAIVISAAFFISLKWKISVHMMGIGGLTGILWGLSEVLFISFKTVFILLIILSGLTGTARLISGTHTQMQIYSGFIIGFVLEWFVIKLYTG